MRDPQLLPIADVLSQIDRFDCVIDARSPSEYAEDHLPQAINAPVLDDEQRALVGTIYRQESAFAARRLGAALVSRNIGSLIERLFGERPPEWRPLVYCWRGGNRSGALATVLARIGWRTVVLEGGYREFRRRVIADLERWPAGLQWRVLAGRTGAGKSLLLQRLAAQGEQVLDLEAIARHRGSVLGVLPGSPQPSQKAFETALWQAMRAFDPQRPVFVESESRRVGRCHIPDALIAAMRNAHCTRIEAPLEVRAELLMREYEHFTTDRALLAERLDRLVPLHGHERVNEWKATAAGGLWPQLVRSLLALHYDPAYDRSTSSNYRRLAEASQVRLESSAAAALDDAAGRIASAVSDSRSTAGRDSERSRISP